MKRLSNFTGLAGLLEPISVEEFLQTIWGKAIYYAPGVLGERTAEILSLEEFEFTIAGIHKPNEGWLHLSNNGFKKLPDSLLDGDGLLRMAKIRAAFAQGESLYLTKGEKLFPSLMHISRSIQVSLSEYGMLMEQPVSAHIFLTPPHSQAFPVHRDEHASLVLQLEGSKDWTVYEPMAGVNDGNEGSLVKGPVDADTLSKLRPKQFRLYAGDMLYVPEWWPHDVKSSDDHSLHATIRLFPLRYSDILETVMTTDRKLQQGIESRDVRSHGSLINSLLNVMNGPGTRQRFESNFGEFVQSHLVPDKVLPGESLRQVLLFPGLTLQSQLVRPEGNKCVVMQEAESVSIRFPGNLIRGPREITAVFDFVSRETRFRPIDMPDIPGIEYDKLEFAQTMVADGLLNMVYQEKQPVAVARKPTGVLQ